MRARVLCVVCGWVLVGGVGVVVETVVEAGVESLVVEASVVQPAGRLQRELAGGWSGF